MDGDPDPHLFLRAQRSILGNVTDLPTDHARMVNATIGAPSRMAGDVSVFPNPVAVGMAAKDNKSCLRHPLSLRSRKDRHLRQAGSDSIGIRARKRQPRTSEGSPALRGIRRCSCGNNRRHPDLRGIVMSPKWLRRCDIPVALCLVDKNVHPPGSRFRFHADSLRRLFDRKISGCLNRDSRQRAQPCPETLLLSV